MTRHRPDLLLHEAHVLTVDSENRLFERGTVVVDDGRIVEVRSTDPEDGRGSAEQTIDCSGKLVMPGLVNAHTHLELTPLLGAFSDLGFWQLWATAAAIYSDLQTGSFEYLARAGYELAALNFLRSGVTTINSIDAVPSLGVDVLGDAGLRASLGSAISDMFWDTPTDEQFARARSFIDDYHGAYGGRIHATICPHVDWACTRSLWERAAGLADEHPNLLVHTHLLELDQSNTMARANGASDSLGLLEEIGLLDDRLLAGHFRAATAQDVQRAAQAGVSVAHCPSTLIYWNHDADAQWTPVPALREADVPVGIGLDDHYWHDSYDLFREARQTRLAANLEYSWGQFASMELVRMLTIDAARAMGRSEEIGSIESGKKADLIVVDTTDPKFVPTTNLPAQVVNNATAADVETVIVDGSVVVRDGVVETMDRDGVLERTTNAVARFQEDSGWSLDLDGGTPPSTLRTIESVPKRGPAKLFRRLFSQSAKETLLNDVDR
ncbi:amidohydrolase family protein [Natronoarchaeum mannanilyticum]|uniref:Amidohydrolase family protein n=1 Tax=Natronoarchaeum mannanilyticum TaxID=926360 RepID=A0AAV3TGG9_9EURY